MVLSSRDSLSNSQMLGTNGEEQAISRVVAKVVRGWGIQFEVARPGDALRWMIGREEWH